MAVKKKKLHSAEHCSICKEAFQRAHRSPSKTAVMPEHRHLDAVRMYADEMAGKLRDVSDRFIEAQYCETIPKKIISVSNKAKRSSLP